MSEGSPFEVIRKGVRTIRVIAARLTDPRRFNESLGEGASDLQARKSSLTRSILARPSLTTEGSAVIFRTRVLYTLLLSQLLFRSNSPKTTVSTDYYESTGSTDETREYSRSPGALSATP